MREIQWIPTSTYSTEAANMQISWCPVACYWSPTTAEEHFSTRRCRVQKWRMIQGWILRKFGKVNDLGTLEFAKLEPQKICMILLFQGRVGSRFFQFQSSDSEAAELGFFVYRCVRCCGSLSGTMWHPRSSVHGAKVADTSWCQWF